MGDKGYAVVGLMLVAAALILTAALASVFSYYPVTLTLQATPPPVMFEEGSNAGQADLSGTITVSIGANQTSLEVTLHPTYQTTYYKDVARLTNTDTTSSYNVWIRVNTAMALPAGSTAQMILTDSGGAALLTVDLTTTGTSGPVTLNAGASLYLDFKFTIPEGTLLASAQGVTADVEAIYTPSAETPP